MARSSTTAPHRWGSFVDTWCCVVADGTLVLGRLGWLEQQIGNTVLHSCG